MNPATLVNLPDASTTLTAAAAFAAPVASTLTPIAFAFVGIIIGGLFVALLGRAILNAVSHAFGMHGASEAEHD
jgi:ABC-type transport system involved in cytochrome bd biosynthesis fused ATPase/permease subunit